MECLASKEDETFNSSSFYTIDEQRQQQPSNLSLLTDLAEEIYANEIKRSKSRSSYHSQEQTATRDMIQLPANISILSDISNKIKRPKTVPSNRGAETTITSDTNESPIIEYESEDHVYNKKRISIDAIKKDLTHLNENIISKYERAKTAVENSNNKHRQEQSSISRNVCQVCGPEACRMCAEETQRKTLYKQAYEQQALQHTTTTNPPNSAVNSKYLQSATNQSLFTVNTKSAMSSKAPQSSYDNFDNYHDMDNAKLLSIIIKSKYNMASSENEIEDMIRNDKLFTHNRSSPYNLKRTSAATATTTAAQTIHTARTQMTLPSTTASIPVFENDDENENEIDDIYNNDNYVEMHPHSMISNKTTRTLKEFDEPVTDRKSVEQTLNSLKQFNVTEYYFRNMKDLRAKSYLKKDKLLLSRTPVPTSSNKLFLNIERFDIAEKYKKTSAQKPTTPTIKTSSGSNNNNNSTSRMKRNITLAAANSALVNTSVDSSLSSKQQQQNQHRDSFEKYKFVSLKKFQILEPKFTQLYGPPLLQLKMQKFDEIYDKFNHDKNFKLINRRAKFF